MPFFSLCAVVSHSVSLCFLLCPYIFLCLAVSSSDFWGLSKSCVPDLEKAICFLLCIVTYHWVSIVSCLSTELLYNFLISFMYISFSLCCALFHCIHCVLLKSRKKGM